MEAEEEESSTRISKPFKFSSLQRQILSCSGPLMMYFTVGMLFRQSRPFFFDLIPRTEKEFAVNMSYVGDYTFSILGGLLMHFAGRKIAVMVSPLITVFCAWMLKEKWTYGSSILPIILIHGCKRYQQVVSLVYVAELTHPDFRSSIAGAWLFLYHCGEAIGSPFVNEKHKVISMVLVMSSVSLLLMFLSPETPYWLALKGRRRYAAAIFDWLRDGKGPTFERDIMLETAETGAFELNDGLFANVFSRTFSIPLLVTSSMFLCAYNVPYLLAQEDKMEKVAIYFDARQFYLNALIFDYNYYDFILEKCPKYTSAAAIALFMVVPRRILFFVPIFTLLAFIFVVPIVETYSLYISFGILRSSVLVSNFGSLQQPPIMAAEMFPAMLRDIGSALYFCLQALTEQYMVFTTEELRALQMFKVSALITILVGFSVSLFLMPEMKGLTMEEAEEEGYIITSMFQADVDEEMEEEIE